MRGLFSYFFFFDGIRKIAIKKIKTGVKHTQTGS